MLLEECDMHNFKPFRRIVIIACVIYQMLFSMIGGVIIICGNYQRLIAEMEPSFFLSCLGSVLLVFVLCFPMVWGGIALIAFDDKRKQSALKKNISKQGVNGKQRGVRLAWPQIIKFEEIERDSGESET